MVSIFACGRSARSCSRFASLGECVDGVAEDGGFANARKVADAVEQCGGVRHADLDTRGTGGIGVREFLQLGDGADGDQLRLVDVADAATTLGLVHVMRGDEEGDAFAGELKEQVPERAARYRVDAGGGLIEEDNLGRVDDGAGKSEALLPSTGELSGAAIHVGFDAGERLHLAGACGSLRLASRP